VEPVLDAVTGWRAWNLSEDGGSPLLLPSGAGVDTWPRGHPVEARCSVPAIVRPRRRDHDVPELSCRCGVYANRSLDAFSRRRPAWPPAPVIGRVSMWGRTVLTATGWMSAEYPSSASMKTAMTAYNDIVRRIASDLDVPIVDLEPSVPRDLRHFIDDVHYTPEGARRVADLALTVVEAEISRRLR
jgi:hypothetical protein